MKIAIAAIVVVLLIAGGYYLFASKSSPYAASATSTTTPTDLQAGSTGTVHTSGSGASTGTKAPVPAGTIAKPGTNYTITYTNLGFNPSKLTIKRDTTVNFVNNSTRTMWIASNPHPTNAGYNGTTVDQHCPNNANSSFDECTAVGRGGTYSFTFLKTGTWGYHNHASSSDTGTIIVTN